MVRVGGGGRGEGEEAGVLSRDLELDNLAIPSSGGPSANAEININNKKLSTYQLIKQ